MYFFKDYSYEFLCTELAQQINTVQIKVKMIDVCISLYCLIVGTWIKSIFKEIVREIGSLKLGS